MSDPTREPLTPLRLPGQAHSGCASPILRSIALISISMYSEGMGRILIRNVDDAVLAALRRRAAEAGTSAEEEARKALASSVGLTRKESLVRLDAVRRRIGRVRGPSSLDDLRADRARDHAPRSRSK